MGQKNLPLASGEAHARAFEKCGWERTRRKGGNHIILEKEGIDATLSIPHLKEVKPGLLQKQIGNAQLTEEEYLAAFNS